jgi:hypothetical protein
MYGEVESAAHMLGVAADAYAWRGDGLVEAMLAVVERFQRIVEGDPGAMEWGSAELAHLERNADVFRQRLSAL